MWNPLISLLFGCDLEKDDDTDRDRFLSCWMDWESCVCSQQNLRLEVQQWPSGDVDLIHSDFYYVWCLTPQIVHNISHKTTREKHQIVN